MNTQANTEQSTNKTASKQSIQPAKTTKQNKVKNNHFAKFFSTLDEANSTYVLGYN